MRDRCPCCDNTGIIYIKKSTEHKGSYEYYPRLCPICQLNRKKNNEQ